MYNNIVIFRFMYIFERRRGLSSAALKILFKYQRQKS